MRLELGNMLSVYSQYCSYADVIRVPNITFPVSRSFFEALQKPSALESTMTNFYAAKIADRDVETRLRKVQDDIYIYIYILTSIVTVTYVPLK